MNDKTKIKQLTDLAKSLEAQLLTVLDNVDYVNGNCSLCEMVGATLPKIVITNAREVLAKAKEVL